MANKQIPVIGIDEHEAKTLEDMGARDGRRTAATFLAAEMLREVVQPGVMAQSKSEALLIGVVRMLFAEKVLE